MAAGEAGGETEESAKGEHCAAAAAAALRWETGRDKIRVSCFNGLEAKDKTNDRKSLQSLLQDT